MQFLLYNEMLANLATGGCMHNWNIRFENCEILAAAWRKAPHGVPPGAAPHRASERGQTLVEFALVSLVLFLLLLGLIDFGRALWMFSSVSLASREAGSVWRTAPQLPACEEHRLLQRPGQYRATTPL